MANVKRKRRRRRRAKKDRTAIINAIFDTSTKDMCYVTHNEELFKAHKSFIMCSPYVTNSSVAKYVVPVGKSKGMSPKQFEFFKERYPYIYERWMHLIKCCFDDSYYLYRFFGGKNIYMSKDFLDSKLFCIWCLKNGLTCRLGMYKAYLQRKDKTYNFSPLNCYVITEETLHRCGSLKLALNSIYFIKRYEEGHAKNVSYMTAYTRYYAYDMTVEDSMMCEYDPSSSMDRQFAFSPKYFYESVADENSCTQSVFLSRYHYSYLNSGFVARPYDMLKPEFSVNDEANRQGKLSYKQQWNRDKKEKDGTNQVYSQYNEAQQSSTESNDSVYNYNKELDVYSD